MPTEPLAFTRAPQKDNSVSRSRLTASVLIAALGLALAGIARAHDAENGPNGGQIIEVKGHHLELTAKGDKLAIYLSDEGHAPLSSKGASGRAVILDGSKQSTVPLAPAEPNILSARLDAPLAPGARVVVSAKLADGHDVLARFVLK